MGASPGLGVKLLYTSFVPPPPTVDVRICLYIYYGYRYISKMHWLLGGGLVAAGRRKRKSRAGEKNNMRVGIKENIVSKTP